MEASTALALCGVMAVTGAFASTALLVRAVLLSARRQGVLAGKTGLSGLLAHALRNGIVPLVPFSRVLRKTRRIRRISDEAAECLEAKGVPSSGEAALSVVLGVLLTVSGVAFVATRSSVCAAAVPLCLAVAGMSVLRSADDRRQEALRDAVPDALRAMGVCFQSGLSLLQTFRQVSSELKGPLSQLFARAAHHLETGHSAEEALAVLKGSDSSPGLAFVAVALDVQHESGGSMRQVLDAARETVEGEIELARSLRVQTAQAKLSAQVVSIMPFVLVALFSVMSDDFLTPFFSSAAGIMLLTLALSMQAAGIVLVRRMLSVEVR
ncbi:MULTISPECIES: type II secretion system F family protein [unclassified Adlercreutzia]|uniref:type II secretion system F family protein n=1 Tax=unclassified Adlercreutzia TaxID=2636013 RepID=UPI0013EB111E|nr:MULTISPECIES: type II secretion system F family protein [unclassified Adlercreutzia]